MRSVILTALLLSSFALFAQEKTEKRLTGLEKRVTKVEKRVTSLEGGAAQPAAAVAKKEAANPIAVHFRGKKQVVGKAKLGVKLYLEFENLSARRFYAFNGTLVFRNDARAIIWSRPYAHSDPLGPRESVEVTVGLLSDQTKEYLRFVKARSVTAVLEKQEFYAAD